jgi:hypothetical protein
MTSLSRGPEEDCAAPSHRRKRINRAEGVAQREGQKTAHEKRVQFILAVIIDLTTASEPR